MLLATKVSGRLLRGLLTKLDTPPAASDIRSILVRPPNCQRHRRLRRWLRPHYSSYRPAYSKSVATRICVSDRAPVQPGLDSLHQHARSSRPRIPHPRISFMGIASLF